MNSFYYRRPGKIGEYGTKRIPDYTEMAYKEAVSKLRYFLSGNYSPSVRSYIGSSSVKNVESDGDTEKPYTALSEYKPRRLTAKYTTLYADSLNNYNAARQSNAPTAAAVGSEPTAAANPDVINFIQKQEEYIEQLERESQYCRDELNNLLSKVKEVITENEHLHEAQKNKLISRMFHSYNAGSDTEELEDSAGFDTDNQTAPKARRSRSRTTRLEGPNIVFESRISELEAQLTQAKIDLKKVQDENNENKRKLSTGLVDSTCLDGFKRQIDNLQRDKSALEAQISKLKLTIEQKEGEDGRYKRGSDVIEQQLRDERNNLEAEIRRLKDDLAKERNKVRELAGEGARRAIQERSAAEQRYTAHFDELSHDLAAQYDNVAKLQLELERQRREENDLKRELSMKNAAIDELKMDLKNKTATLQADLAQANAEKASLDEELASARLAIERHQRQAKHETNRLNSEIQSLRQRLDRADADLVHARRENLRLAEQIATLEKEINMKNLTPISPEKSKKEKEMTSMLEAMENKHVKTVAELESMIHSQNSLMEKLTGECRLLTDKLDDANRRHKAERSQLLYRNTELMRKLRSLWCSHKKYCTTVVTRDRSPVSGYALSRSSYDLDHTYDTSTPTSRFRRNGYKNGVRHLGSYLSDISLDRIGDSDDDPVKVRFFVDFLEELATLQRQVETLGRSLQPATTPQNYYQAAPTHASPAHRNEEHRTTESRPNNTRTDTSRHPQVSRKPSVAELGDHRVNSHSPPAISRQTSRNSIKQEVTIPTNEPQKAYKEETIEKDLTETKEKDDDLKNVEATMEVQPSYDPNFEQQPDLNQDGYDPNYEQNYVTENAEYQQNYEQQPYTEGYEQNYDQYPEQQYVDPNAQYEGQYENYATDPIYQNVTEYDANATENYAPQEVTNEVSQEYQNDGGNAAEGQNTTASDGNERVTTSPVQNPPNQT